jgi:hypothetical protein
MSISEYLLKLKEKDEYGLYIHTDNYAECRADIDRLELLINPVADMHEHKYKNKKADKTRSANHVLRQIV